MKPVLGLPGRNPETENWLASLLETLGEHDAEVARYRHWQNDSDPDVDSEATAHPVAGRKLVIAKSMGTMVLLASAQQGDPERAVLIGVPVHGYSEAQLDALQALSRRLPCLFIQQIDDFTGSAATLRAALGESAALEEVAGSDHMYADVDELVALIGNWQASVHG